MLEEDGKVRFDDLAQNLEAELNKEEPKQLSLFSADERTQLRTEAEPRVGVPDHEAVGVQGEEDVAQRALGHVQRPREL